MQKKPIQRSPHIVLLSREHHTGLLCCWKIRQGLKKQADTTRIQKYLTYFWDSHLQQHFGEEEEHLFDTVNDDFCRKALQQHQQISALINQVQHSPQPPAPELLYLLADQLEAHIRYEERELFPHLEQVLEEPELKRIGAALEQSHAGPAKDNYPDEFWVR